MATAREENPYQSGGGSGVAGFGKFRKRPFTRSQTTPYDRPATALRNPNRNNGWLSKIVDPAQRFIAYSANKLFSSVFRKRLPPPSPTSPSSEAVQDVRDNHQESAVFVANDFSCKQQVAIVESDVQINTSDGGELTILEKLLKQKTFTSEEINHLTALMRSKTLDSAVKEEGNRTEMVLPSDPVLHSNLKNDYSKMAEQENGIKNSVFSYPYVTTNAPIEEDVASPAELAKAYMGSRPSKVSPSMLGLRSLPREDQTLLKSQHFTSKAPIMSVVPRATTSLARVHDNGFLTPRSHGRSAIHSMARTPYARVFPASKQGVGVALGEPSSSAQYALDHNVLSGSKQGALKRRSSVLDSDIGSVGPIRRIRHKSNLLSSNGLALHHPGSPLSIARSRVGTDASQQPSYSMQKPILLGEVKQSHKKLSAESVDDRKHTASFPLPSRSSEMASKILQQLDKLVSPKEKSFELRLPILNDKSPMKLSSSMLRGQALRSMETVDSSKFLDNIRENELDGTIGNSSATAEKLSSQIDKVENGPLKFVSPTDGSVSVKTDADATVPRKQAISIAKLDDSSLTKPISYPQKKRAFHISANEDYLEMDEDAYPNGALSSFPLSGKETTGSTAVADKTTSSTATILQKPLGSSIVMPSNSFAVDGKPHVGTVDGEKVDVLTSRTSSIFDLTFKPVIAAATAATQTIIGSDKSAPPNGSLANPPLFNFGNKVVPSMEPTSANSLSKECTNSGPVFGLEKVVSSKEPGADAPLVNFGINKNIQNAPQVPFTFSSSVGGELNGVKFGGASDSNMKTSISSTTVTSVVDSIPKFIQSDDADVKTNTITGFSTRASEPAVSSAVSTPLSTSPMNIFTFGNSSNQNGPVALSPSFSSSLPFMVTNNSTSLNMFSSSPLAASSSGNISDTAASASISMTTSTPAVIASSNINSSTSEVASTSSTPSVFKFGSTPSPSTGLPVSSTSGSEPVETKKDTGIGILGSTSFGSSSASVGSTGSGIFGFSSSAMTTVNSQSQVSAFGSTSDSVSGTLAPPATSVFSSSTKSQSVAFGSSASSPLFGFTGNTTFSSGSSFFPSSNPATNIFNSGTTFGQSTNAFSSEANPASSNSVTSSTPFGLSSWQSTSFGSSFNSSSSPSPGFSFLAASVASTSSPMMFGSTTSASSAPQFSFTSAAPTTNLQPAFGSSSPVFAFGSAPVNNDQMGTEDSMAEDTVQATQPVTPVCGQQPAPPQSNFVFGAPTPTPTGASPFQFSSQQSSTPPNPSPFQASGSLEFNSGGSFSLGPGGSDKSGRKIVRVNKNKLRKK
ncbi:hypothetical protein Lalb_Chr19g0128991 [Lupinus albus]|uniref:Nuclear pore complex protein NUP1-like n=1 Tax=Lupinus albus TaxID=3870 RepID=A0A6A4P0C6_LUPAL|nr:hypothetical protein Lalb_Chr19g0128991 [Lupinus albus]